MSIDDKVKGEMPQQPSLHVDKTYVPCGEIRYRTPRWSWSGYPSADIVGCTTIFGVLGGMGGFTYSMITGDQKVGIAAMAVASILIFVSMAGAYFSGRYKPKYTQGLQTHKNLTLPQDIDSSDH